jgi:hypothetical protein
MPLIHFLGKKTIFQLKYGYFFMKLKKSTLTSVDTINKDGYKKLSEIIVPVHYYFINSSENPSHFPFYPTYSYYIIQYTHTDCSYWF